MRKALFALLGIGMLVSAGAGHAFADVAGTSEGTNADGSGNNQVSCGSGSLVPGAPVTVAGEQTGTGGALVVCQDSAALPIQGRIILAGDAASGGYIAADGDADNSQYNEKGAGYARLDVGTAPGVTCGTTGGNLNAEDVSNGTQADCDPTQG